MSDLPPLEKLRHAVLPREQQTRLFTRVAAILKEAINARSPKRRPPGRAGLRAEKGYYRLLYLEGGFQEKVGAHEKRGPGDPPDEWDHLIDMMHHLSDIPDLQSEILRRVESALDEILTRPPAAD